MISNEKSFPVITQYSCGEIIRVRGIFVEAMLVSSQRNVTGTVELILRPYSYTLVGVDSTYDLMKTDFGEYGEVNKAWTADDVKGFTKILGNQIKIYHNVQKRNEK